MSGNGIFSKLKSGRRRFSETIEAQSNAEAEAAKEYLKKANEFKSQKQWEKAIENFRAYSVTYPNKVQPYMQIAYAYLAMNYPGAAYESVRRVLLLDPSHQQAFELFLDLADRIGMDPKLRQYVIRNYGDSVVSKPERWNDAIDFLMSLSQKKPLEAFTTSTQADVRALAELALLKPTNPADQAEILAPAGELKEQVLLRYNLAMGRYSIALKQLAKIEKLDKTQLNSLRLAVRAAHRKKKITVAQSLVEAYLKYQPADGWATTKQKTLLLEIQNTDIGLERSRVLESGYRNLTKTLDVSVAPTVQRGATGLYLLHNSLPYNSAGYATRSHGVILGLRDLGWDMQGVTRPGYPFDRPETKVDLTATVPAVDTIDGVPYHRLTVSKESVPRAPFEPFQEIYTQRLSKLARDNNAGLIHAASNYWNGVSGVMAARQLGIPSVYEVRGLWEVTRISREPAWKNSDEYRFMAEMEAEAARHADVVLALTRALKEEMISRGVDEQKITIAPNGVDPQRFIPRVPNLALKQKLGLVDAPTIGYVGSILDYEGIDTLLESIALLKGTGLQFNVVIVGDGAFYEEALALAQRLGIDDLVKFTGRVPHEEVEDYYSIIDICPLPRHGLPVCEMVSPLKPFEAMAMGKVVVGSNVDAIDEIITPGVNGLLCIKDNAADLAEQLENLIKTPATVRELGLSSRDWVVKNRSWNSIAAIMDQAYEQGGIIKP